MVCVRQSTIRLTISPPTGLIFPVHVLWKQNKTHCGHGLTLCLLFLMISTSAPTEGYPNTAFPPEYVCKHTDWHSHVSVWLVQNHMPLLVSEWPWLCYEWWFRLALDYILAVWLVDPFNLFIVGCVWNPGGRGWGQYCTLASSCWLGDLLTVAYAIWNKLNGFGYSPISQINHTGQQNSLLMWISTRSQDDVELRMDIVGRYSAMGLLSSSSYRDSEIPGYFSSYRDSKIPGYFSGLYL